MQVEYWTSKNDINHSNKHAKANDIEFFAFPYKPYLARVGNFLARVSEPLISDFKASVTLYNCLPNGDTKSIAHKPFKTLDEAFIYASEQLNLMTK